MTQPTKAKAKTKAPRTLHGKLLEAIGAVDRPGTYCASDDLPLVMQGLEADGLGAVRLPLGQTQARRLIELCHQAPSGKGTETLRHWRKRSVKTSWRLSWN